MITPFFVKASIVVAADLEAQKMGNFGGETCPERRFR
jgi:hypothetical protein